MHGLARAYQDSEEFDKAIVVANRITELDPDDVLAHTSLSILYQRKGWSRKRSGGQQGAHPRLEAATEAG